MLNRNEFKGAIARAGLTSKELARRIGISQNTLSAKMNGKGSFDLGQVDKICVELKITDDAEKIKIFLSESSQNRDKVKIG